MVKREASVRMDVDQCNEKRRKGRTQDVQVSLPLRNQKGSARVRSLFFSLPFHDYDMIGARCHRSGRHARWRKRRVLRRLLPHGSEARCALPFFSYHSHLSADCDVKYLCRLLCQAVAVRSAGAPGGPLLPRKAPLVAASAASIRVPRWWTS